MVQIQIDQDNTDIEIVRMLWSKSTISNLSKQILIYVFFRASHFDFDKFSASYWPKKKIWTFIFNHMKPPSKKHIAIKLREGEKSESNDSGKFPKGLWVGSAGDRFPIIIFI